MKKIFLIVVLSGTVAYLGACQDVNSINQSQTIRVNLSADEFQQKILRTPDAQLVDVRTADEFADGHLKGAVNMNVNRDDYKEQFGHLDKLRPVFVYCMSGGRSSGAARILQKMGFHEIYNLDGGIIGWERAGKPLLSGAEMHDEGLSLADFEKKVTSKPLVLVDFNAAWCQPCKRILPYLQSIEQRNSSRLLLLKIDADKNKKLLTDKGIQDIPYLELYKDGRLIWKHSGSIDEQQLISETKL